MTINVGVHLGKYLVLIADRRTTDSETGSYEDHTQKLSHIINGFMVHTGSASACDKMAIMLRHKVLTTPAALMRAVKSYDAVAVTDKDPDYCEMHALRQSGFLVGAKVRGVECLKMHALHGFSGHGMVVKEILPGKSGVFHPDYGDIDSSKDLEAWLVDQVAFYQSIVGQSRYASVTDLAERTALEVRKWTAKSITVSEQLDVGIVGLGGPTWKGSLKPGKCSIDFMELG